jgi:hypothetical protein
MEEKSPEESSTMLSTGVRRVRGRGVELLQGIVGKECWVFFFFF